MQKVCIHITGAAGSGVSTLGKALAEARDLNWLDTDNFFWLPTAVPFTEPRPIPKRLELLERTINDSAGCIISGSLDGWGDPLVPSFTLVVYVDTPATVRIQRLRAREAANFGDRILPGGDMHEEHLAFVEWATHYDAGDRTGRSRPRHEAWLTQLPCPVIRVNGELPVTENIEKLLLTNNE